MSSEQNLVPKHFVVIVPGYMGSKLRDPQSREVVWVNLSSVPWQPWEWESWLNRLIGRMKYPSALEPAGMMDEIVFLPPWGKMENYERLVRKLISMGYKADMAQCFGFEGDAPPYDESSLNVYAFPYDWRQDNRASAQQLKEAIGRWSKYHEGAEVWVIAHSNGGVVARWYIEELGGKERVTRLFLMGSPWDGTPKALRMAFNGFDTLFRRKFEWYGVPAMTRGLVRSFPSVYQLIPLNNKFLRDDGNNQVNPFTDGVWLDDPNMRAMLQDGMEFTKRLDRNLSVETVCFFGTRRLTPTSGRVLFGASNRWREIVWDQEADAGDGTIPERSAVHPRAKEKLPYPVGHGDIYVNEAVLEKLRFEMIDRYRQMERERAVALTDRLRVVFEQGRGDEHEDFYGPGEAVNLWADIHRQAAAGPEADDSNPEGSEDSWLPVADAQVRVEVRWRQPLQGQRNPEEKLPQPGRTPEVYLTKSRGRAGRYEGRLKAPEVEGYYDLQATVSVPGEPTLRLAELIAVEAAPDPGLMEKPK